MILFTKPHCQKCEDIKRKLQVANVAFEAKSMDEPANLTELVDSLNTAGIKNPLMPVIKFDDGTVVSNDMGLYKALKERKIL